MLLRDMGSFTKPRFWMIRRMMALVWNSNSPPALGVRIATYPCECICLAPRPSRFPCFFVDEQNITELMSQGWAVLVRTLALTLRWLCLRVCSYPVCASRWHYNLFISVSNAFAFYPSWQCLRQGCAVDPSRSAATPEEISMDLVGQARRGVVSSSSRPDGLADARGGHCRHMALRRDAVFRAARRHDALHRLVSQLASEVSVSCFLYNFFQLSLINFAAGVGMREKYVQLACVSLYLSLSLVFLLLIRIVVLLAKRTRSAPAERYYAVAALAFYSISYKGLTACALPFQHTN